MKFNKINSATINKAKEILEKAEDKSSAIVEVAEMLIGDRYEELRVPAQPDGARAGAPGCARRIPGGHIAFAPVFPP